MKNFLFGGAGGASASTDLGLLILRVLAGLSLAFAHGTGKLPPSEGFVKGVEGMGMPSFMAWGATFAELCCGILLALGLFTRPATVFILITMTVAVVGVHWTQAYGRKELALLYGCIAILFMLAGAGRFSVDRLIRK